MSKIDYKIKKYQSKLKNEQISNIQNGGLQIGRGLGSFFDLRGKGKIIQFENNTLLIPNNGTNALTVTSIIRRTETFNNDTVAITITMSGTIYIYDIAQVLRPGIQNVQQYNMKQLSELKKEYTFDSIRNMPYHPAMTKEEYEFMNVVSPGFTGIPMTKDEEYNQAEYAVRFKNVTIDQYETYEKIMKKIYDFNTKYNINGDIELRYIPQPI